MNPVTTAGIELAIGECKAMTRAVLPMLSDTDDKDAISDAGFLVGVLQRLLDELQGKVEQLRADAGR